MPFAPQGAAGRAVWPAAKGIVVNERSLDEVLRSRRSPRQRWALGGVALAMVLIALVVIGGLGPLGSVLASLRARIAPVSVTRTVPHDDLLYLDADLPGASVTLDGAAVRLPRIGRDAPLRLTPGPHLLAWQAAPFAPQQCRVWAPPEPSRETCAFAPLPAFLPHASVAVRVALLTENLTTLASTQQTRLLDALRQSLPSAGITAHTGEQYLSERTGRTFVAAEMRATLRFTLDVAGSDANASACQIGLQISYDGNCFVGGRNCHLLCTVPWQARTGAEPGEWEVFGLVRLAWEYASTKDGRTQTQTQPIDVAGAAISDHLVAFRVRYSPTASRWQATALLGPAAPSVPVDGFPVQDDPACAAAQDTIFGDAGASLPYAKVQFFSGTNPAQGCVILATPVGASAYTQEYLMRFGVIVPVDAEARAALPTIAPATPAARAVALAILLRNPGHTLNLHPRS